MTVSVDPRRAGPYSGNDATTAFPFAFKVFAKEDIQVVIADAARDLMTRIHTEFDYHPQATDASTPALESLTLRKGVCQDFAHLMIALCRALNIPARLVVGYVHFQELPPVSPAQSLPASPGS